MSMDYNFIRGVFILITGIGIGLLIREVKRYFDNWSIEMHKMGV